MISTGNDIVDLSKIDNQRTAQPRFFGKMLVPAEIEMYNAHKELPFVTYVWLLWSIKESVFKFHKRNNPALHFAPRKTIVQELSVAPDAIQQLNNVVTVDYMYKADVSVRSVISLDGHTFYGTSYFYKDVIHSIAQAHRETETQWAIQRTDKDTYEEQSLAVREFFTKHFSHPNTERISVRKNEVGYPVVTVDGIVSNMPVSFSHHGNYVAFSCLPQKSDCVL